MAYPPMANGFRIRGGHAEKEKLGVQVSVPLPQTNTMGGFMVEKIRPPLAEKNLKPETRFLRVDASSAEGKADR